MIAHQVFALLEAGLDCARQSSAYRTPKGLAGILSVGRYLGSLQIAVCNSTSLNTSWDQKASGDLLYNTSCDVRSLQAVLCLWALFLSILSLRALASKNHCSDKMYLVSVTKTPLTRSDEHQRMRNGSSAWIEDYKLTSKEIYPTGVATSTPSMPTSRKWAVRACDFSPFIFIYKINKEVVEECGKSSIVKLATKEK